jgi:hypothetical protein
MAIAYAVIVLGSLAALNLWATAKVLRDRDASRGQRAAQAAVVWLLPVVGALLVIRLKGDDADPSRHASPANPDAGDDYGLSGHPQPHSGGGHHDSAHLTE